MKISIATPTFGSPSYLKECINSVIGQTLTTAHIVCGGQLSFSEEMKWKNLKIINHAVDPGMVNCWSIAASLAETEYIGFLADDNCLQPDFADRMVGFLENHPECDLVFCNQYYMDAEGKIDVEKSKAFTSQFGRDLLPSGIINETYYNIIFEKNSVPIEACLIRKRVWDSFGPFQPEARGAFDHEFAYRVLLSGGKIGFIPDYLMNFRWHDGAYTSRAKKDHLIGTIWSYEHLMHSSKGYEDIFKKKSTYLKARLLRYRIPWNERINIIGNVLREKNGLSYIIKNSFVRLLIVMKFFKVN
jgi:GT2 family glycosyltransferase